MKYSNREIKDKIISLINEDIKSVEKIETSKVEFRLKYSNVTILIKEHVVWINDVSFQIEMLDEVDRIRKNYSRNIVDKFLDSI